MLRRLVEDSSTSTQAGGDGISQLGKLKELLDAGALTEDEFSTQKAKILERL